MGALVISNKILEKYFGYLIHLDDQSKNSLIKKLTSSIKSKKNEDGTFEDIFGAWDDNKSSDEIIGEIKNSRIEKTTTENFE